MDSSLRIIVTGLIAQHPHMGGVAWDYLQFALGLKQLGHDVYYLEDSGEWPYNLDGGDSGDDWVQRDPGPNISHLAAIMDRFGFADRWAYRFPIDDTWFGMPDAKRREVIASADLLINVSGTIEHPEKYRYASRLAYIDSDPLFTQIKALQEKGRPGIDAHDVHFSFGERFSANIPVTGHEWLPTRHPMVLSEWDPGLPHGKAFTTVMNWTSYEPLMFEGKAFGQKDMEFKRFLDLPSRVAPASLEVALAKKQHAEWRTGDVVLPPEIERFLKDHPSAEPADLLALAGWKVVDPQERCGTLDSYRDYITSSKAEWSVAKNGYVAGRSGWFSCRSTCYLAAARPVVVQDTGFSEIIPVGEGLFTFNTPEEAVAAIAEVEAHYDRHSRAARAIAEEYFDSAKVLTRLVDAAMSVAPRKAAPARA